MDLSWCIICDRHCIENNLYCSESCRFQDSDTGHHQIDNTKSKPASLFKSPSLVSPPASPVLAPFLYSFQSSYDRRRSASASSMTHASTTSNYTGYNYYNYQFTPSSPSESSLYADDT